MRSLIRRIVTTGLIGTTLLSVWLGSTLKAFAIPREKLLGILGQVPVFVIADSEGAPVIQNVSDTQGRVNVFLSHGMATQVLATLREQNPDVGSQVDVQVISLADSYTFSEQSGDSGVFITFIPTQTQIGYAQPVWEEQRQTLGTLNDGDPNNDPPEVFPGTPLFVAWTGTAANRNYLSVTEENGTTSVPFFFDPERFEEVVTEFKAGNANVGEVNVEVLPLEGMIRTLSQDNDSDLERIQLVPLRETVRLFQQSGN